MTDIQKAPQTDQKVATPAVREGVVLPEIIEAIRQEGAAQVNINILLQQVSERSENPAEMIKRSEQLLEMAQKFEDHRLKTFKQRADALIDVKLRDPDEIQKRQNNRARRCLKFVIATGAPIGFAGAIACVLTGASIVIAGMFATAGALSLAMLGPLASGESLSSTDVVRIVSAIRGLMPTAENQERQGQGQPRKGKK